MKDIPSPRTLFAVAAYLAEEGADQRLGCDIVPDLIRCVQGLVLQRCELETGSELESLSGICRQLDGILEDLNKIDCKIRNGYKVLLLLTVRHSVGQVPSSPTIGAAKLDLPVGLLQHPGPFYDFTEIAMEFIRVSIVFEAEVTHPLRMASTPLKASLFDLAGSRSPLTRLALPEATQEWRNVIMRVILT